MEVRLDAAHTTDAHDGVLDCLHIVIVGDLAVQDRHVVFHHHMDVRDDIFLTPFGEEEPEGGTIDGFFVNIDRTRRVGVELGAAYRVVIDVTRS